MAIGGALVGEVRLAFRGTELLSQFGLAGTRLMAAFHRGALLAANLNIKPDSIMPKSAAENFRGRIVCSRPRVKVFQISSGAGRNRRDAAGRRLRIRCGKQAVRNNRGIS